MLPYVNIGPLLLQTPGLAILAGLWIAITLVEKRSSRLGLDASAVNNMILVGLIAGVIGARLAYAARYLNVYIENPLSLFSINTNTLSLFDGVLIGAAAAGLYLVRKNLPFASVLDALTPGLAVFMVALGLAHLLSGVAYGAPSRLPWSIYLWGDYRHPSQVYEILAALAIFITAWKWPDQKEPSGLAFLWFVALTALARILLGTFRGDSLVVGGFRVPQLVGLAVLGVSLVLIHKRMGGLSQGVPVAGEEES